MGTRRRKSCKYGKLKKPTKTKSGRKRRCKLKKHTKTKSGRKRRCKLKKSRRKYKSEAILDKFQNYASLPELPDMKGIKCKNKNQVPDNHNCYSMWPRYPCYDKQTRMCFNEDGDTQLIDPIGDVMFSLGQIAIIAGNSFNKAKSTLSKKKQRDLERRIVNWFQDWGTTIVGLSDINKTLIVRY